MAVFSAEDDRHIKQKGATEGNRTLDRSLTKRLLCRLSYGGICRRYYTSQIGFPARDYKL